MKILPDFRTRLTIPQIQREIAALQRRIDDQARAAEIADREAARNFPGQDVAADKRRAQDLRTGLRALHVRLHALQARLPQPETIAASRVRALLAELDEEARATSRRLLRSVKDKPAWRQHGDDVFGALPVTQSQT